ncbi:MAG TPA: glycosyltransferase family 39 protein [Humibacter sp.]|nr:glycosyltransferase family 39 protein [Humibacter sp.]
MTAQTDEHVVARVAAPARTPAHPSTPAHAPIPAREPTPTRAPSQSRAGFLRLPRFWPFALPPLAMLVLGVWGLDRGSMFGTEAATYWAARLPIATFWRLLSHVDAVHGIYYLMMRGILAFGANEVVLRIPSVLGACIAALLLTYLGHRLTGSRAIATAAGGAFVSLTVVNGTAQEGRSYAIDLALVLAASAALVVAVQRERAGSGRRMHWVGYAALVVVAGYLHEFTVLAVAAHAVTLAWSRADRKLWRRFCIAAACAVLALVPLILISHAEDSALSWVPRATPASFVDLTVNLLGPLPLCIVMTSVLIVAGMLPVARWASRSRPERITLVALSVPLLAVPGSILILESMLAVPLYGGVRYVLYSTAGAALLAAAGACRLGDLVAGAIRPWRAEWVPQFIAGLLIACLFVAGLPLQISQRTAQGRLQNLSAAAAFVAADARPGDAVLYIPLAAGLAQLGYPDDFGAVTDIALSQSPERAAEFYGVAAPRATILARIRRSRRLWVLGSMTSSSNVSPRLTMERRAVESSFHRVTERDYAGIDVYLFLHD